MIRLVTALVIFLVCQVTYSQTKFEQGMQQAFKLMEENKNEEAANTFERIAQVETDNWLPYYNLALLKARTTFEMKDKTKVAAQLKAAEEFADKADDISPDNSEIYVLKAFINVAKIVMDPMTYGASLTPETTDLYQKAIRLNTNNPRARSGLIEFEMGGARYFGQDLTPHCKRLQETVALYDNFKPESEFHPNWGKEWVLEVLKGCGDVLEATEEVKAVTITVNVPNVTSDKGAVRFALYDKTTFMQAPLSGKMSTIKEGIAATKFEGVKPGEYAIICYHDSNNNDKFDFDANGMPAEDWSMSNNPVLIGPPTFDVAKFTVENKSLDLTIKF
ncbi:DUF2141 domain-containing protein [Aureibaculum sp. 2210JD6-5]|uniref:DUF2141 domain-containing protein n=1 Tax=Aureibaculum sp. 2210JD6-5 TaxID=3103957 RepID=UPI002AAD05BE|nr:DUF2141 domain-containing protein [Aureibaculum sp. 2210JD6-5]MDY7395519.1 DUF2141 domain-containing protein [Aureibaculum sp. 2210JD6-5]